MSGLDRRQILPEPELPAVAELLAEGRRLARTVTVGDCPFLNDHNVRSESEYKRRRMAEGSIMLHAQFGYRSLSKSQRAYAEIYERIGAAGYRVDRYGICLDWSMGYPAAQRADMGRGTGLILERPEDFATLTQGAPVAPHFGDFVIGTPAAVENTAAALAAGATSIGNLGQYFTFRMPRWHDDVRTTAETVKALALCAAQPVEIMVHSNLDDGFAALFSDMACSIGAVLIERYIVEELIGGHVAHCYGHTFSEPLTRMAFQRALAGVTKTPGSMVYGNTTIYAASEVENYANLASYLLVDIVAQRITPTGHGLNPVPVTEAMHIPEIDEIVDVHLFANRLVHRAKGFEGLFDLEAADRIADQLIEGGQRFKEGVLMGLAEASVDTSNPLELLLAIRRLGAKRLEEVFGPGEPSPDQLRRRVPIVRATTLASLEAQGQSIVASLDPSTQEKIRQADLTACVTCTDVHEYGKILVETVLNQLGVAVVDGGISTDPDTVAARAKAADVDFVAVSTYSGVALRYLQSLRREMTHADLDRPIFIGGKLTQLLQDADDQSGIPADVTDHLSALGAQSMIERVGIVGVGHLATYLVEGLRRASPKLEIILSPRNVKRSAHLSARFGARVAIDNQAVVDTAPVIILSTRPGDAIDACEDLSFRSGQTVISVVAGLSLRALEPIIAPAMAVRAMPISCVALNTSLTLLYPDHLQARELFALLGQVHVLPDEPRFTPASAVSAFYGWVYALLDETVAWTVQAGVPPQTARSLVLETVRGAADMALAQPDQGLGTILDTLATPGGITEHGLNVLYERQGLSAWTEALNAVLNRLGGSS